jgi:uncharacterized protein YdbL (DUF1318 family)
MKTLRKSTVLLMLLVSTACVTINVYFPAEAAEKAADRIILDVYKNAPPGQAPAPAPAPAPAQEPESSTQPQSGGASASSLLLDWLITPAHAEADLSRSSPAIRQITARMEARIRELAPYYTSGAVGMTRDGHVAVRDQKLVALPQRNAVKSLVAEENRDRDALYAEMARANGHPEWEADIRATFARRWVDNARSGWWFMDQNGNWQQK